MDHAGADLESVKIKSWADAAALLWQVAVALNSAERNLQFEVSHHRSCY